MKFDIYLFILLILLLIFFNNSQASVLEDKLQALNVTYDAKLLSGIENGLKSCSIEDNVVLSVIMVESSFKVDAVNKRSHDYGLMQINAWHVKHSKLDRERLISDASYNIAAGCSILKWFLKTYKTPESIGRYNCGTRKGCVKLKSVKRYMKLVMSHKLILDVLDASVSGNYYDSLRSTLKSLRGIK